jgi:hypothetical protein
MNIAQIAAKRILTPHELVKLIFIDYNSELDIIRLNMAIYGVNQRSIFVGGNSVSDLIDANGEIERIYDEIYLKYFNNGDKDHRIIDKTETYNFSNFTKKGNQLRITFTITGINPDVNRKQNVWYHIFYNIVNNKLVYDHYEYKVK